MEKLKYVFFGSIKYDEVAKFLLNKNSDINFVFFYFILCIRYDGKAIFFGSMLIIDISLS